MAKFFKTKQAKKRMISVLAVTLAASLSAGVFAACGGTTPEEEESESATKIDTQLIKNGNFEFYADNNVEDVKDKRGIINTPDNWSRSNYSDKSGSASASDAASGIINTAEWDTFARPGSPLDTSNATANWENEGVNVYDRVKYLSDNKIDKDSKFEYYDDYKYSVTYNDLKYFYDEKNNTPLVENPGVHTDAEGTSVLMIHNQKVANSMYGTAQYYTASTTVTLNAGTAASLSFWVKTSNLTHFDNREVTEGAGAYVAVTNTVGGKTLDQMQINNINTKGVTENNGWVKYQLYVRANTFATSTIRIVFGLGRGSSNDVYETVNGYAFFDDLTCDVITEDAYETATADVPAEYVCDVNSDAEAKKFVANNTDTTYALNLYSGFTAVNLTSSDVEMGLTEQKYGNKVYTSETYKSLSLANSESSYLKFGTATEIKNDATAVGATPAAEKQVRALKSIVDSDFKAFPFGDAPVIMMMSYNGAPYTAKVTSPIFSVPAGEKLLVSFFVKTSEMQGFTGAGITVVDGNNETTIKAFDSTTLAVTDVNDDVKNIYDSWQRCFFFLTNETEVDKNFSLKLTYGPTTIVGTTAASYVDGYAAFTNFETYAMTKDEYGYASTNDRAVKVSLTGETASESKFDDVAYTQPGAIESDIALLANYRGVVGGDKRVGGEAESTFNQTPEGVYAGLINGKYDYDGAEFKTELVNIAMMNGVLTSAIAENWYAEIFGFATQPLTIVNTVAASYGFIANNSEDITAGTTQMISVRVKVSNGAKAYVYLIDTSDLHKGYTDCIKAETEKVTYWYDDDGNVCTKDPSDKDFDEKTDIAYERQENGLFTKVGETETKYYANLANYATDEDGNLVTSEEKVAFYGYDGKFYAYYDEAEDAYDVEVFDFDHAIARYDYTNATPAESYVVVDGTEEDVANKWVTVTFYVSTGDQAKHFRLEVWSGSRDGEVKNPEGSYVIFDNVVNKATSNYADLLDEAVLAMEEEQAVESGEHLEGVTYYTYTLFDDADYVRYDATTDTDENGDPYGSYVQSAQSEVIVSLFHQDKTSSADEYFYEQFLNFNATDFTVEPDVKDEHDHDHNDTPATEGSEANIWLLGSSIALVVAMFVAMVAVVVRSFFKAHPKSARVKNVVKVKAPKATAPVEPKPEKKAPKKNEFYEND